MNISVSYDSLLLCFPSDGKPPGSSLTYNIRISEQFARAFVDYDANNDGLLFNDRVDSGGPYTTDPGSAPYTGTTTSPMLLGDPDNSTQFRITLEAIPSSVASITWPASAASSASSWLILVPGSAVFDKSTGIAIATYSFEATNQTNLSDISFETFDLMPLINLGSNQTATGQVLASVTLAPTSGSVQPRFLSMDESDAIATNNPPDDPPKLYASIIRCNCFLLFTYVTADAPFNTGIVIANTTGDDAVFGSGHAPNQIGKITFYFYDRDAGYVGFTTTTADVLSGASFVDLVSSILPTGVTTFSGYIIAQAEFQFCHGFAFIADEEFGSIAHGYIANVIPDPAIKGINGVRTASAAGDPTNIPAGEGLNN
jgi:hypothetical protein